MKIHEIVTALNEEISRLEQVRDLLANNTPEKPSSKRRGRPKGSLNKTTVAAEGEAPAPKRQMSAEGRARIAAAQRRRWAVTKKRAGKAISTVPGKAEARKLATSSSSPRGGRKGATSAKGSVRQPQGERTETATTSA